MFDYLAKKLTQREGNFRLLPVSCCAAEAQWGNIPQLRLEEKASPREVVEAEEIWRGDREFGAKVQERLNRTLRRDLRAHRERA